MSETTTDIKAASHVIRLFQTLHQLTLDATLAESRQDLIFRILNRTVSLCSYDRAVLWDVRGRTPKLLGVSGQSEVNAHSPLAEEWRSLLASLPSENRQAVLRLDASRFADEPLWTALETRTPNLRVLWIPILSRGRVVAGLWLERWGAEWLEDEERVLVSLARGYGGAWEKFDRLRSWSGSVMNRRSAMIVAAVLLLLLAWPVRLRVIAPCEVVARDPYVVAAPLSGVIEEILVQPGVPVKAGTPLLRYDGTVAREELKVVRQQVRVIRSRLERAEANAFEDPEARTELQILRDRLAQEQVRLDLARQQVAKLEVVADRAGVVAMENPHEWRGRVVHIGERVMTLVQPGESLVRLWIPESDNLSFEKSAPVRVFLNVRPTEAVGARLVYVAEHARLSPGGTNAFVAEAEWMPSEQSVTLGLRGSAVLKGERVSLAYWLLRKPLAAVRRYLGV